MPNKFLEGLLQFPRLKALKLDNIDIADPKRNNFNLSRLSELKLISLSIKPSIKYNVHGLGLNF
jgi:hypothetical protein